VRKTFVSLFNTFSLFLSPTSHSLASQAASGLKLTLSSKVFSQALGNVAAEKEAREREEAARVKAAAERVAAEAAARALGSLLLKMLAQFEQLDVESIFFSVPTDLEAPGYSSIVKSPMSWTEMRKKLRVNGYSSVEPFVEDFLLVVRNCLTYNDPETIFYHEGLRMLRDGSKILQAYVVFQGFACLSYNWVGREFPSVEALAVERLGAQIVQAAMELPKGRARRRVTKAVEEEGEQVVPEVLPDLPPLDLSMWSVPPGLWMLVPPPFFCTYTCGW
jgi:hypothetical protein